MSNAKSLLERILLEERASEALAFEHVFDDGKETTTRTWGELRDAMWRLAAAFDEMIPAKTPMLLVCTHGPEFAALMVAGFLTGRPVVPAALSPFLSPQDNVTRLLSIVIASKASSIVCSGKATALAPAVEGALRKVGFSDRVQVHTFADLDALLPKGTGRERPLPRAVDAPALVQFTSGSTGTPRGVLLTLEGLRAQSAYIEKLFCHDAQSRGVIWLPHVHNTGLVGGVLQPLFAGFPCHFLDPARVVARPSEWLEKISAVGGTTSGGPNFIFDACVAYASAEGLDLSRWRVAFTGAEPVSPLSLQRFAEKFERAGFRKEAFLPLYGLAEATLVVAATPQGVGHRTLTSDAHARAFVASGFAADGHTVLVVDPETFVPLADGQEGEVWVHGPCVALGYAGGTPDDAKTFQGRLSEAPDGWPSHRGDARALAFLRTGDLGFLRDGVLCVTGRRKETLIVAGRKFHALDLEHTLKAHVPTLSTRPFVVVARPADAKQGRTMESLCCVVEWSPEDTDAPPDALYAEAARALSRHDGAPLDACLFVATKSLPRTDSGKIQRFAVVRALEADTLAPWKTLTKETPAPREKPALSLVPPPPPPAPIHAPTPAPSASSPQGREPLALLLSALAEELGTDAAALASDETFADLGLTSMAAYKVAARLEERLERPVPVTLFFEHPTPREFAGALRDAVGLGAPAHAPALARTAREAPGHNETRPSGLGADKPHRRRASDAPDAPTAADEVVVVGYALRFPGADDAQEYWTLLENGQSAIGTVPPERWDNEAIYNPEPRKPGKTYARHGGFLKSPVDLFDASTFGLSSREADTSDPQQRLLLETALAALEHAGLGHAGLRASNTGVAIGVSTFDYARVAPPGTRTVNAYSGLGNAHSICAGRLSYTFQLEGPSFAVDTACSSSLVALHQAVTSLRSGETSAFLVGGVNLLLSPELQVAFSQAQMLSPDGQCRSFDDAANGYVRGEGVAVAVLMRADEAKRRGLRARAVVTGTAVNQDGPSNGLTAPNGKAQERVLQSAWRRSGVPIDDIAYVECHGTGTRLGDPIEFHALANAFQAAGRKRHCYVGSVKSNVGHLEAAAGMAGFLKCVMALERGTVPPSLHFRTLNRNILASASKRLHVLTEPLKLPEGDEPVALAQSSFGFGGTNAHVVVARAPKETILDTDAAATAGQTPAPFPTDGCLPFVFSAGNEFALRATAERMASHLERVATQGEESGRPAAIVATAAAAARTRTSFGSRAAVILPSRRPSDALAASKHLRAYAQGQPDAAVLMSDAHRSPKRIAFVFSGQGATLKGAAKDAYDTDAVFRKALERMFAATQAAGGSVRVSLRDFLLAPWDEGRVPVDTDLAQLALFTFQVALAEAWRERGLVPAIVLGHSVGEFAAAVCAGLLSPEAGLKLVLARGKLMQGVQGEGAMAAIFAGEDAVRGLVSAMPQHVRARLDVTTLNGPDLTCVGGHAEDVAHFVSKAGAMGLRTQPLAVNRGFHSPHMDGILDAWEHAASGILDEETGAPSASRVALLSTSDLSLHTDPASLGAPYWRDHARQPTRFWPAIEKAVADGIDTFVEIGPDASLSALLRRGFREEPARSERVFATFEKATPRALGPVTTAARLWVNGARFDWSAAFPRRIPVEALTALPPTALARKRHWYATPPSHALTPEPRMETRPPPPETPDMTSARKNESVLTDLTSILASLLGKKETEVKPDASLLELGADSLVLMDALKVVEDKYGVSIPVARMFQDLSTTRALASFLAENGKETLTQPAAPSAKEPPSQPPQEDSLRTSSPPPMTLVPTLASHQSLPSLAGIAPVAGAGGDVVSLIQTQLSLMQSQLALLVGGTGLPSAPSPVTSLRPPVSPPTAPAASEEAPVKDRFNAMMPERSTVVAPLEPRKQAHLDALVRAFTARTKGSKELTQAHRKVLAENRASAGFRLPLKEMVYPLVVERSQGAHVWDVDGNRYVDITMGFGVNLFGHNEPFLREAIEAQLKKGIAVGPQSHLAGEVARVFTTLTGLERVAFTNSGTEAVMTAVRLARAGTGRKTVVLFANSYHGTFDGILARSRKSDPARKGSPVAPGIPQGLVDDVVVLDYGTDEALAHVERLGREVAAVLVEPVQSRNPHLQPGDFLRALREVTRRNGTALIFDEVITGLRTAQGGAQEVFGVRADIATYGKVLGGGMPIGAVAGSADFLDAIDGGFWRYGDASVPPKELTFFAGTFCKHPLAMAAARATLETLLAGGGGIQRALNARVEALCARLNAFFQERGYADLRLAHFGSLFRFVFQGNMDLLFYHLNLRGVYVWEGRNLFLSTAHDDADVRAVEDAIKDSLLALEEGGYLVAERAPARSHETTGTFGLTGPQRRFAALTNASPDGHMAAVIPVTLRFRQQPNLTLLEQAFETIQRRHDALRLRFAPDLSSQTLNADAALAKVSRIDLQDLPSADRWTEVKKFLVQEARKPFRLAHEPPLRATAIAVYENEIVLALSFHHTVCDGLGAARVLSEMAEIYSAGVEGRTAKLEAVFPFTQTLAALPTWLDAQVRPHGKGLWEGLFADIHGRDPLDDIPLDALRTTRERSPKDAAGTGARLEGQRAHLDVKASVVTALKKRAQESNTTLFMHLFAAWGTLLGGLTGRSRLALPVPLAARGFKGSTDQVANWVNLMPLPLNVAPDRPYSAILADVRKAMMVAYAAMDYPAEDVVAWLRASGRLRANEPFPRVTFNLEPAPKAPKFTNAEGSLMGSPVVAAEFPLTVNLTEISGLLLIDADFQTCEFTKDEVMALLERYRTLLETLARDAGDPLASALVTSAGNGKDVRSTQGGGDDRKQRWKKRIANLP